MKKNKEVQQNNCMIIEKEVREREVNSVTDLFAKLDVVSTFMV